MNNTGVVRRIDDLGRVVIPKDIRRYLHIREGDPLNVSLDEDKIILSKYCYADSISKEVKRVADAVSAALHLSVAICDDDRVIAVSGLKESMFLNAQIHDAIINRTPLPLFDSVESGEKFNPVLCSDLFARFIQPICCVRAGGYDAVGAIIVFEPRNFIKEAEEFSSDSAKMLLESYAGYLKDLIEEVSNW